MISRILESARRCFFGNKPNSHENCLQEQSNCTKIKENCFSKVRVFKPSESSYDHKLSNILSDTDKNLMKFSSFGITDVGLKRSHNEDFVYSSDELGLYLVADGMGGHAAGEIASHQSIEAITGFVHDRLNSNSSEWPFGLATDLTLAGNTLISGIYTANDVLCKMQKQRSELNGMGTTIAALCLHENEATIAHVGDSRVYRFRKNSLELLTSDHSWVNEQLIKQLITPEEAKNHRYRNVITRALGNRCELEVDYSTEELQSGDIFLLCSDGLSGMIEDHHILDVVIRYSQDLRKTANTLVNMANAAGGHDNISIIVVRVD